MRRREFLEALGAAAGLATAPPALASRPCPPKIAGVPGPACGGGALSTAASGLEPGQWTLFTPPPEVGSFGISWQNRTGFWDGVKDEFHFMAKAQSGGPASHWVYSEATDSWRRTGADIAPGQAGHIWVVTFDHTDDVGDYYYLDFDPNDFIRYMDNSVEAGAGEANDPWRQTSTAPFNIQNETSRPSTSICYHPNLFGAGDPGVLVYGVTRLSAWRKNTDSWVSIATYTSSSSSYFARRNAPSVYIPSFDRLIMGTGIENTQECLLMDAGSGGNVATSTPALESVPTRITGQAHQDNSSKMLLDPRDDSAIMLLESSADRVWINSTGGTGDGWKLAPYTHPFWASLPVNSNDYGSWTCGAIPKYGLVLGLASYADGGASILWRPG